MGKPVKETPLNLAIDHLTRVSKLMIPNTLTKKKIQSFYLSKLQRLSKDHSAFETLRAEFNPIINCSHCHANWSHVGSKVEILPQQKLSRDKKRRLYKKLLKENNKEKRSKIKDLFKCNRRAITCLFCGKKTINNLEKRHKKLKPIETKAEKPDLKQKIKTFARCNKNNISRKANIDALEKVYTESKAAFTMPKPLPEASVKSKIVEKVKKRSKKRDKFAGLLATACLSVKASTPNGQDRLKMFLKHTE